MAKCNSKLLPIVMKLNIIILLSIHFIKTPEKVDFDNSDICQILMLPITNP